MCGKVEKIIPMVVAKIFSEFWDFRKISARSGNYYLSLHAPFDGKSHFIARVTLVGNLHCTSEICKNNMPEPSPL